MGELKRKVDLGDGKEITISRGYKGKSTPGRFSSVAKSAAEAEVNEVIDASLFQIVTALREAKGNLLYAAQALGVDRALLKRKVDINPYLKRMLEECREEIVDEAEHQLYEQVKDGYFPAVSMTLRTLGQNRGYTERQISELELSGGAAALIEAMRKGTETTVEVKEYSWEPEESQKVD